MSAMPDPPPDRPGASLGTAPDPLTTPLSPSRLSITQRLPSAASARGMRRRRKRVFELAKPKTNWQALRDR